MRPPSAFARMPPAILRRLGRSVVLAPPTGGTEIVCLAVLRLVDDVEFSGSDDGGAVSGRATIAFATTDAPAADRDWTVTDSADSRVWRLGPVVSNGRGMSRADLFATS